MPSKVIACTCKHFDQDRIHGKGQRAHNQVQPKVTPERWRCTVCGNVTTASTPPKVTEPEKKKGK
jgi:hypothetical protein